jgi:hypothetical protein
MTWHEPDDEHDEHELVDLGIELDAWVIEAQRAEVVDEVEDRLVLARQLCDRVDVEEGEERA